MAWRIRHSIAKRRGRAIIASVLAILFLVLAPTVGAMLVGGVNSKLTQVNLLELDDQITAEDTIFGSALNESNGTYTISWNGGNYSTDIESLKWSYRVNGSFVSDPLSYSITDDGKLFLLVSETQTPDSNPGRYLRVYLYVTPEQLMDAKVSKIRVFYTDGEVESRMFRLMVSSTSGAHSNEVYDLGSFNESVNGSWVEFDINELTRLKIGTSHPHPDDVLLFVVDPNGSDKLPGDGSTILFDLQFIGPENPLANNWLNYYFALAGFVALVGAVFATPYVNIRSFRKAKQKHTKRFRRNKKRSKKRRKRR